VKLADRPTLKKTETGIQFHVRDAHGGRRHADADCPAVDGSRRLEDHAGSFLR
jgi:hypothetical protein